jgi:G patch domain-containing protein 2
MSGNFESDSLNENFSPSRPNVRRKRKFKRMAVEYETTPSTPHTASHPMFPSSTTATVKKRVLKHSQDNYRGNLFFGKRKRPHRERYADYESYKHSSSVPRQRGGFLSQKDGGLSYLEYKSRNRASSMSTARGTATEKIMPLNKSIVSKIEKISQDTQSKMSFNFTSISMMPIHPPVVHFQSLFGGNVRSEMFRTPLVHEMDTSSNVTDDNKINLQKMNQKSGSFESALPTNNNVNKNDGKKKAKHYPPGFYSPNAIHNKHKQSRRLKLQFDDQNFMDCGNINDFLSSSSLSSSDSEAEETNESDHEGDDELTDWPGHEAMVNFASKNEFKRANKKVGKLPQIKQQDDIIQDDDTLMSADELHSQLPTSENSPLTSLNMQQMSCSMTMGISKFPNVPSAKNQASHPINIAGTMDSGFVPGSSSTSGVVADYGSSFATSYNYKQPVESEMSGETSNHFLSSPNAAGNGEVREIRAGCRRIREERPGFSIITSFNEDLLK